MTAQATPSRTGGQEDQLYIAYRLCKRSVDPNAKSAEEMTALHYACRSGNALMVRLVLQAAADYTSVDGRGHTPMEIAEENGHEECIKELKVSGEESVDDDVQTSVWSWDNLGYAD